MTSNWISRIRAAKPLIECLTNDVTITDVANTILDVGASPVMGVAEAEIPGLVKAASAVVINIGTFSAELEERYLLALKVAHEFGKPVVFDPVGAGATDYRTDITKNLLQAHPIAIIRGNASEIKALLKGRGSTVGVEAADDDVINDSMLVAQAEIARNVAKTYRCVVSMSGQIDVICDSCNAYACRNGVPWLCSVTGTGCSLTGLLAAFAAVATRQELLEAATFGTAMMGVAGELAFNRTANLGLGSFHVALHDELSMMTDLRLEQLAKLQPIQA